MNQRKKLQVFVSSTYTDLHDERQAAVQAILTAGHIPAGMELFAAGDQSQIEVIRQWISESDVFLLILGGRYGSVEPSIGKSYIHLEYEHAVSLNKPLFSLVITEDYLTQKAKTAKDPTSVIEQEHYAQWKAFKATVLKKLVRFWSDPRDIKLHILETLGEFMRRQELIGWIRGDQAVNTAPLAEELARLAKENDSLRARTADFHPTYGGLSFAELYALLSKDKAGLELVDDGVKELLTAVADEFGDSEPGLVHSLWLLQEQIFGGGSVIESEVNDQIFGRLSELGLVVFLRHRLNLTEMGRQFLMRLIIEKGTETAQRYISVLRVRNQGKNA
jgi:hypothetical protein